MPDQGVDQAALPAAALSDDRDPRWTLARREQQLEPCGGAACVALAGQFEELLDARGDPTLGSRGGGRPANQPPAKTLPRPAPAPRGGAPPVAQRAHVGD